MVQNVGTETKRPGVLPYALGGTAAGALAGWGLSKAGFTQATRYTSWEDILKDSKDALEVSIKDKKVDGFAKTDEASNAIREHLKTFNEAVSNARKTVEKPKELTEALTSRKTAFEEAMKTVKEKITKGDIKVDGFDASGKTEKEIAEKARQWIGKNVDKEDSLKTLKDAMNKVKEAKKAHTNSVYDSQSVKDAATKAWDGVKDKVKDLKKPRTKMLAIGGAVLGLLVGALLLRPKAKPVEEAQA